MLAISAAVAGEVHVLYTVTASLSAFSFKKCKMHSQHSICFSIIHRYLFYLQDQICNWHSFNFTISKYTPLVNSIDNQQRNTLHWENSIPHNAHLFLIPSKLKSEALQVAKKKWAYQWNQDYHLYDNNWPQFSLYALNTLIIFALPRITLGNTYSSSWKKSLQFCPNLSFHDCEIFYVTLKNTYNTGP